MNTTTRRWRMVVGICCFVAAAVVALVGYLKLSLEPLLNHQLPYLASAGFATVVLSVLGASLIVADHLHTDDARTEELTAAIQQLAEALASDIERPARRAPIVPSDDPNPTG